MTEAMPFDYPHDQNTPLDVPSSDKGSDTNDMFDYQYGYAAKIIIETYANANNYVSIYSEYHDDILAYDKEGRFEAYQIKTRSENYEGFRFTDDDIVKTITRFVKFEIAFPDLFKHFIIVSNCGFSVTKNYNIQNVIDESKKVKPKFESQKIDKIVTDIVTTCKTDRVTVINVLKKMKLEKFSDRDSYAAKIKNDYLWRLPDCKNLKKFQIDEIYSQLIHIIRDRSKNKISELIPGIIILERGDPNYQKELEVRKRITKQTLEELIKSVNSAAILTTRKYDISVNSGTIQKMQSKMIDYGGIDQIIVNKIEDFVHDADRFLYEEYLSKKQSTADEKVDQIFSIVENAAHDRLLEFESASEMFGPQMLNLLNQDLKQISQFRKNDVYDTSYEILKGVLGILTCDCKVRYSKIPKGGF